MLARRHSSHWAWLWVRFEAHALPVDSSEAKRWDERYKTSNARQLLERLDHLHQKHLSLDCIDALADAVTLAYRMGQQSASRTSS